MIIKTVRRVYVLMNENSNEESSTVIGVFSNEDEALNARARLEAVSTFEDYFTVRCTALDDFTYVEHEEERYAEITCEESM